MKAYNVLPAVYISSQLLKLYYYALLLCRAKNRTENAGFLRAEPLSSYFEDRKGYREGKKLLSAKSVFPFLSTAPVDDEAKKHNENLPGMGGVFNTVNLHVYHYAGNNPVKYTDPDGRDIIYKDDDGNIEKIESSSRNEIHTPASDRELLEENAKEMKKHALNISYFYKKVKSHGDWDFKNFKEEDGKRGWYWFNGKLVTAEEFGNLHYGYVGAAGGFSTLLLIEAPGIAQVKAGTAMAGFWLTNFDDPRDTQNILRGIYAYDGSLGNKITRTIGDHFYLSFCFTSFRIFTFTAFILENKLKRRK